MLILQGRNLWPSAEMQGLEHLDHSWRAPLLRLFDGMVLVSKALTSALALALGRREEELAAMCDGGDSISIVRCFHYLAGLESEKGNRGSLA
jgi:isopenicillin N synthase-like dioxygenase